ncbi:ubiquitin-protein ligase E3C isoform X2 [Euwallacea fornicatus]|uniref:ubiquitin-protein ligase E3C isoform X2 n=1 Tax=Euwallacea fornicatus TaxID=995702 RepID=UPI00338D83EC
MAFKLRYSFEGNLKTKPEQNLSGASTKLSRDLLIQKTHEERRKRQEQRLKLQSAELLQSHIRSYLVRTHVKNYQRQEYVVSENILGIEDKLKRLLFFYHPRKDFDKLSKLVQQLLDHKTEFLKIINLNPQTCWTVKRLLVLCLKHCSQNENQNLMLQVINTFNDNHGIVFHLIRKGYFGYLRILLDAASGLVLSLIMHLIHRPFKFLNEFGPSQDLVFSEFCNHFLKPPLTYNIKIYLIPYFKTKMDSSFYDKLIRYLNSIYYLIQSNSLFYCMLALEPADYEPGYDSIHVFSLLSKELHSLKPSSDLSEDSDYEDDEDVEMSEEEVLLSHYLNILNNSNEVRKLLNFLENNCDDELVLTAFVNFAQNLLLVYKDSIRKYLLLYKLGLNSIFLKKLWSSMSKKHYSELQINGALLVSWRDCHTKLSVFCDMFTFYTETLTDKENSDTSETFTQDDLHTMSTLLKSVAIDLVEIAFPLCRASSVIVTPEIIHLYRSCLSCLKMLHTLDMRRQFCPAGFWTARKIPISPDLAKKNYLSKKIVPFGGTISNSEDDEHLPPLSTIEQRSLAILQELPFLIIFNTRVQLLRDFCRFSLGENEYQRMHHELTHDNSVVIRRNYLYEDAFEKISTKSESDLKHRVRIQFINNVGLEEAGIDGGGIFKEFINEVLKTAFDPNRGFFLMTGDNALYPNPNVHLIVENYTEHYKFIGRLVGKAIFENILVDLPLAEFFLAKLLVERASTCYLKSLDPVLYRNLLYLRDYTGDVSDLGLDFSTVNNDLGETRVMDLKPNGREISVTNENRLEYIQRLADLKLNVQLKKQCAAFCEGLNSVVPVLWLKLFNHKELQVIIGGDTQEVDLGDMRAHTVYSGDFTADHPTILLFWKILYSFNDIQKRQLLKFVTSCSRPPLLGFKELNPPFCIQSSGVDNRMPTASTCLNLLKIPIIKEEDVLRSKLLAAIEQQAGFELS